MAKASVKDLGDIAGKVVLVRQDLNVPLKGETITDDTRIREAIPTLKFLVGKGAKVLVATHLVSLQCENPVLGFARILGWFPDSYLLTLFNLNTLCTSFYANMPP
jgi:phosphoglycerate kinase